MEKLFNRRGFEASGHLARNMISSHRKLAMNIITIVWPLVV